MKPEAFTSHHPSTHWVGNWEWLSFDALEILETRGALDLPELESKS